MRTYSCHTDLIARAGLAPEVPKQDESCKRRIRPALVVFAHEDQILPDRQIYRKSVCLTTHLFPRILPNTTRPMIDITTQTKTRATSSPSERPHNRNPKLPIPEATSKAYIRT